LTKPITMGSAVMELNTGIVIAGAYADKVRRTLFAQLKEVMKSNKDFTREIARASGELNRILYHILVEALRVEKGDAVRVRIKYSVDSSSNRIVFDYNTLSLEVFRRVKDEEVSTIIKKVLDEKLEEVKKQYATLPSREEAEKILKGEAVEPEKPTALEVQEDVLKNIKSIDLLGETITGGYLFKIKGHEDQSIGMLTLEPSDRGVLIDVLILSNGKGYRYLKTSEMSKEVLAENPGLILKELQGVKPAELEAKQAEEFIREKTSMAI